ncbi:MAG: TetR/AcrR family transcriptional regulator [Draconibacterium sp.]
MGRNSGETTRRNILFQSFLLFSSMPYDKVTFTAIEKATGLSRGAILYHFKSKQEIFNATVENSLLDRSLFLDISIKEVNPLESFILDFATVSTATIKEMAKYGVKNTNLAYYNIESEALYFYNQFDKLSRQMRTTELRIWAQVIKKAQEKQEIREDIDAGILGTLFLNAYYGHALAAVKEERGCNVELLTKELLQLRQLALK